MVDSACGIAQASHDVSWFKVRQLCQNLLLRKAGCQQIQDIRYPDAHAPNTGFASALFRIDRDAFRQLNHSHHLAKKRQASRGRFSYSFPSPASPRNRRLPTAQLLPGQPVLPDLGVQEGLEEVPHALVEDRVDMVVPLLEPGEELRQPGQQGFDALYRPPVPLDRLGVVARQGLGLCCRWSQPAQLTTSAGSLSREQWG